MEFDGKELKCKKIDDDEFEREFNRQLTQMAFDAARGTASQSGDATSLS